MRQVLGFLSLAVSLFAMCIAPSCFSPRDQVNVDNIAGSARRVVERHDASVIADATLTPASKDNALADSTKVVGLLGLRDVARGVLEPPLRQVLDRHDAYVAQDGGLTLLERDTYLSSTEALRAVLRPPD